MEDPVLFALSVLFILGVPGPTNTLLATGGATVGFRRALPLMVGESVGYSISILAIGLVLGPWIAGVPAAAVSLRLAVGTYLILLAVRLWQRGAQVAAGARVVTVPQVFVTTLLNPKAILFALGVVPFGSARWPAHFGAFLLLLFGVAMAWIALGAGLGRAAAATGTARLVPRLGALAVMGFAILLVAGPLMR